MFFQRNILAQSKNRVFVSRFTTRELGMNTGVSYDTQAKYSPCPLPVKKTDESDARIDKDFTRERADGESVIAW